MEPTVDRYKAGFTSNLQSRLKPYKTSNPSCRVVKVWPCLKSWEPAIQAILGHASGVFWAGGETYEVANLDAAVAQVDAAFGLLPTPRKPRPDILGILR